MKLSVLAVSIVLLLIISFAFAGTKLEKAETLLKSYKDIVRSGSENGSFTGSKKAQHRDHVNRIKEEITKLEQTIRELKAQALGDLAQELFDDQAINGELFSRLNIFLKKYKQYRDRQLA